MVISHKGEIFLFSTSHLICIQLSINALNAVDDICLTVKTTENIYNRNILEHPTSYIGSPCEKRIRTNVLAQNALCRSGRNAIRILWLLQLLSAIFPKIFERTAMRLSDCAAALIRLSHYENTPIQMY